MDKPVKVLLAHMKAKKFKKEEEGIKVNLFADGVIVKLIKVLVCLGVGIEVIDKFSPSVKCFPVGRTFRPKNNSNSQKNIRDYNYQQFLDVYCETAMSDYTNFYSYKAWKKTCPMPAGDASVTSRCSEDLEQLQDQTVQGCNETETAGFLTILRSKHTKIADVFKYIVRSYSNPESVYDCRPRTLYYNYMSWTILIYALILGLGPTLWNVLFGRKIADRTRHVKDFFDTIVQDDAEKEKKMISTLKSHVEKWDSSCSMRSVAILKAVFTLIVTVVFILIFFRGFRFDIGKLAFTICKVHDYEYAKCASARVGLLSFVWLFTMGVLGLILMLCFTDLRLLIFTGGKDKLYLVKLLKNFPGLLDTDGSKGRCAACCSDLVLMSLICKRNRNLFERAERKFLRKKNRKTRFETVIDDRESVL